MHNLHNNNGWGLSVMSQHANEQTVQRAKLAFSKALH